MSNLPEEEISEFELKEVFSRFGEVIRLYLVRKDGLVDYGLSGGLTVQSLLARHLPRLRLRHVY